MSQRDGDRKDLVFIGDVHLDRDDPELESFLGFLDGIETTTRCLIFMGDLFNLWIGKRDLEQSHQKVVIARLERMRKRGLVIRYLEGNRDFQVRRAYMGTALDDVAEWGIVERLGSGSLFAIHGDLANPRDRLYRVWRRMARSRIAWGLFHAVPGSRRFHLAEAMEARLRRANREFKEGFPEEEVRAYAGRFLRQGHDAVILGHFHVEKDLEARPPSPPGRVLVLPEWKGSRRYLRVTAAGEIRFENVAGKMRGGAT